MNFFKIISVVAIMLFSTGCKSLDCKPTTSKALPGTDTVVVGVYIDEKGYPQASIDTIKVLPGQKIIFAGPDKFDIFFKDQKSPIDRQEVQTSNNVLIIEIPRDIFEREQKRQRAAATNEIKELTYRYGIRANGKVTDPAIIITRE